MAIPEKTTMGPGGRLKKLDSRIPENAATTPKNMLSKEGVKIVLTASATEMSDFHKSSFFAFMGGFSKGPIPLWLLRKWLYLPVENNHNSTAKYAPYGLRKVEAVLLENGFDESDVAVVHPFNLGAFVGMKYFVFEVMKTLPVWSLPEKNLTRHGK